MDILHSLLKINARGERKPDFERFVRAITTNEPGPVTIGDLFADPETVENFLSVKIFDWLKLLETPDFKITYKEVWEGFKAARHFVRFCTAAGWDYTFAFSAIPFPGYTLTVSENTSKEVEEGRRGWVNDNRGPIMSWEDFDNYKWPTNYKAINAMSLVTAKSVPDGMKVMVIPGGMFEWTTWLMGLVPFSYALVDDPELVDAVIEKVSHTIYKTVEGLMDEPNIGGMFMGDDLGFSTGTMVSPDVLREKFFPRTKRIVDLVHSAGKIAVLHSCGNVYSVMDDIIDMGFDAKHSFEDKIMPVEEVHAKWGDRIGLIGGVDMDIMAQGSEADVRKRTREILDACASKGRYVLGTGNSVANYIPIKNYKALLSEAQNWNMDNFGRRW
jgi:uroporphyrinogen decarboxylase